MLINITQYMQAKEFSLITKKGQQTYVYAYAAFPTLLWETFCGVCIETAGPCSLHLWIVRDHIPVLCLSRATSLPQPYNILIHFWMAPIKRHHNMKHQSIWLVLSQIAISSNSPSMHSDTKYHLVLFQIRVLSICTTIELKGVHFILQDV